MNPVPTLKDLPPPPAGRTGWPWTEETPRLADRADGKRWPRISIVTPCFNHEEFIEETVRSVLLQGYPNLEFFVMDGGSKDGSPEIIRKYAPFLTGWVSEKDNGQSHAINKGLARATGEIWAYINSDDFYLPGAFERVIDCYLADPTTDLIHGRCRIVDRDGHKTGERFGAISRYEEILNLWDVWWQRRNFVQPEVFWTKRIAEKIGPFREDLYWVMDYEYWVRIMRAGGRVGRIEPEVACFRILPTQKSTQPERTADELLGVAKPFIWEKEGVEFRAKEAGAEGKVDI